MKYAQNFVALAFVAMTVLIGSCTSPSDPTPTATTTTTTVATPGVPTGVVAFSLVGGTYELGGAGPVSGTAPTVASYSNTQFPQELTLTLSATGDYAAATIRYTTDGTDPTVTSTAYTAPLTFTTSQTIKAKAFLTDTSTAVVSNAYDVYRVLYFVDAGWTDKDSDGVKDDSGYILGSYQGEVDRAGGSGDSVTGKWWGVRTGLNPNTDAETFGDSFNKGWYDETIADGHIQGAHLLYVFEVDNSIKTDGASAKLLITTGIRSPWDASGPVRPLDIYTSTDSGNWSTATNKLFTIDADNTYQEKSAVIDGTQIADNHDLMVFSKSTRVNGSNYDNALVSMIRVSVKQ